MNKSYKHLPINNKEKIVCFAITEQYVKEVKQDHYKTKG